MTDVRVCGTEKCFHKMAKSLISRAMILVGIGNIKGQNYNLCRVPILNCVCTNNLALFVIVFALGITRLQCRLMVECSLFSILESVS